MNSIAVDLAKSVFQIAVSHRPGKVAESHRLTREARKVDSSFATALSVPGWIFKAGAGGEGALEKESS
jgi:hypothetical protein